MQKNMYCKNRLLESYLQGIPYLPAKKEKGGEKKEIYMILYAYPNLTL